MTLRQHYLRYKPLNDASGEPDRILNLRALTPECSLSSAPPIAMRLPTW